MGGDSLQPFFDRKEKGHFVLCRTSNPGSSDLQTLKTQQGRSIYQEVARLALGPWNRNQNIGLVVGATQVPELQELRDKHPEAWFLIPGVGAQGGAIDDVLKATKQNIIINSSRGILYASSGKDYLQAAQSVAQGLQKAMAPYF